MAFDFGFCGSRSFFPGSPAADQFLSRSTIMLFCFSVFPDLALHSRAFSSVF